ncbi:hypothetical protein KR074_009669, partial [Drosophila pseudoananassae]
AGNNDVPQIVNRHVLKAVDFLTQDCDYAPIWEIKNQVRYTMRNSNPVDNLSLLVMRSLRHLADVGIL